MALLLVASGIIASAQTPDYSRMSNRLADWTAQNAGTLNMHQIGIRIASDFDIKAFDKQL